VLAGVMLVSAALVAGCSGTTPGQASPAASGSVGQTTTTTSKGTSPTTRSGTPSSGSVADIDPCSLLTAAEKARYQTRKEDPTPVGQSKSCGWLVPACSFGIIIADHTGVKDINPDGAGTITQLTIGGRSGIQDADREHSGGCIVDISITDTSMFAISVAGESVATSCQFAVEVATLIEPRIPKG